MGWADLSGAVLVRRVRRQPAREHRDADRIQPIDVAHEAIGDECANALIFRHAEQQITDDAGFLVGIGGHHDDVARLGVLDRSVWSQVVARPTLHRQRHAAKAHRTRQRPHAIVKSATPAIRVHDPAGGRFAQTLHETFRRP